MGSCFSQITEVLNTIARKCKFPLALVFFVLHAIDIGSDVVMCVMLHNAPLHRLFIASACSLVMSLVFTIFYDATIRCYVCIFGDVVAKTFRLNRNVMTSDLIGGFISFFCGPLTPFILSESYNTSRLTNRLSIVTAIVEDIPQAVIAIIVLFTQDGWNSELAFIQVLSSLVAGIVKYFAGIFLESNRKSLSDYADTPPSAAAAASSDNHPTSQL